MTNIRAFLNLKNKDISKSLSFTVREEIKSSNYYCSVSVGLIQ